MWKAVTDEVCGAGPPIRASLASLPSHSVDDEPFWLGKRTADFLIDTG
jgi:hypothetical protein